MPDFSRRLRRRCSAGAIVVGLGLLLSACGSGAGPAPIPSPPPTPADAGLIKSEFDGLARSYTGSSASLLFMREPNTGKVTDYGAVTDDAGDVTITYNGPNDYTLTDSSKTHRFASANRLPDEGEFKAFEIDLGEGLHARLRVVDPNRIDYQYLGWGKYGYELAAYFGKVEGTHFFLAGIPTRDTAVPKTGSASFTGGVYGVWNGLDGNLLQFDNSKSILAANFSDGTVASTLELRGRALDAGGHMVGDLIPLGTFTGTGTIVNGHKMFQGGYLPEPGFTGAFQGAFYGPGAEEVGLAFSLEDANHSAVGVAFGKRN